MSHSEMDMKEYINKRMMEITSLKDRQLFKEVAGELLVKIYEYNKDAYQNLERSILNESAPSQRDYAIYVSLTDMARYDATDPFLSPMLERDTKKTEIAFDEIVKALKEKQSLKLFTVFIKAGVTPVHQLVDEDRVFKGIIKTQKREYRATFRLQQNTEYMDLIKELYYIFSANYQPWSTVCEAYLTKMMDVCLVSSEPVRDVEELIEIQVDFEEYTHQVKYDMIPLWNLKPITKRTSTYPSPGIDRTNFEHRIFSHQLRGSNVHLIRNTDVEITNIRKQSGDLLITCPIDKPHDWNLYEVKQKRGAQQYPYPVLSNQYKDSLAGSITEMYRRSIKTKGELARLMESFGYQSYVGFQDVHVMNPDEVPDDCSRGCYNMDGFIQDEIRVGDSQMMMVIDFTPVNPANYLNEDIMSFLVTQAQKIFPEYLCVGRMQ